MSTIQAIDIKLAPMFGTYQKSVKVIVPAGVTIAMFRVPQASSFVPAAMVIDPLLLTGV